MILAAARVERLAHAMQALELVAVVAAGPLDDGGDGERVVGRELREEARPQRQQLARAGDVVQVGHRLAGEDRIVVEPALLRALHLGVPIGALDQAHHQPAVQAPREVLDIVDHRAGALLIGLDGEAEAVPAGERGIGEHGGDHVERQFEPVGLLRIDGEVEVVAPWRLSRERDRRAAPVRAITRSSAHRLVARMQRRELDRDAGTVRQRLCCRRPGRSPRSRRRRN